MSSIQQRLDRMRRGGADEPGGETAQPLQSVSREDVQQRIVRMRQSGSQGAQAVPKEQPSSPLYRAALEKVLSGSSLPMEQMRGLAGGRQRPAVGDGREDLRAEVRALRGGRPVDPLEDIRREHDSLLTKLDYLKAEQKRLTPVGSWDVQPDPEAYEAAQERSKGLGEQIRSLETDRDRLAGRYYAEENQQRFSDLRQDPAARSLYVKTGQAESGEAAVRRVLDALDRGEGPEVYQSAADQVRAVYGLSPEKSGSLAQYMNDLTALLGQQPEMVETMAGELGGKGYDYERMSGFEQMGRDAAAYQESMDRWTKQAQEHQILSSAASVAASPGQGIDFLDLTLSNLGHNDAGDLDSYRPMNIYGMSNTNFVSAVRGTIAKDLEERTDWDIFGQNVASFLYQTGMSIADSGTQVAAMGPFAIYAMGASAASNQARDIILRGGSNEQALWGGLAAGVAESFFEKFSVEQLLKPKTVDSWRALLKETAKQAGVEASEETFTEIANILSDAAIMGENSSFRNAVAAYQAQGMTREEAERRAFLDSIGQVAWAGVGGAISGGAMGGGRNARNFARNGAGGSHGGTAGSSVLGAETADQVMRTQNVGQAGAQLRQMDAGAVETVLEAALAQDPKTESYRQGQKLREKVAQGGQVTDAELGSLYISTEAALRAKEKATSARQAQEQQRPTPRGEKAPTLEGSEAMRAATLDAMVRDSEAIGERGRAALTSTYDGTADSAAFYGDFMQYYNAGTSGQKLEAAQPRFGDVLSRDQKYAAWAAGQNDGKASRAVGRTEPGLMMDGYARGLDRTVAEQVDKVAKMLGVQVRFADQVEGGKANARIEDGVVTIAKDAESPVRSVLGHEIAHHIQTLAPAEYEVFRAAALADTDFLNQQVQGRRELYARSGVELTDMEAMDELAADYAGRLMEDGRLLERFIREHQGKRTLLEKLRGVFRTLADRLTGKYRSQAWQAERKLGQALKAAAVRAENLQDQVPGGTMGATRYSMMGGGRDDGGGEVYAEAGENHRRGEGKATDRTGEEKPAEIRGQLVGASGRRGVVDPSFGKQPVRAWAAKGVITPPEGTVSYQEQQTAIEYGIPSYVIHDDVWRANGRKSPAFSVGGQIYLRETLDPGKAGKYVPHEATHVMKQVGYQPYLDFISRTPDMLEGDSALTKLLLQQVARHRKLDLSAQLTVSQEQTLYDEFNATVFNSIAVNDTDAMDHLRPAFKDFEVYAAELREIHERFKRENSKDSYSLKGSAQLSRDIESLMKEARKTGRGDAEVQADIRALVDRAYQGMLEQYGAIKPGEKPAREVQVPKRTAQDRKVSQTVRTILEAGATPEAAVPTIQELVAREAFSYEVFSDKAAKSQAEAAIHDKGYATALADWSEAVGRGEVSKANTAMGWALYDAAANAGDLKSAMTVLTKMVAHQRSAAQAVQATRILKQMSPAAQLYGVQRSVADLQEELLAEYGDRAPDLKIDQELARALLEAKDQKARDEAMKELFRDIGRQLPARFVDKWNAWRYLAMLGNPRTHMRNIVGNAGFAPVVAVKDLTATAIEAAVDRVSGGKLERSKAMVGAGKADRALLAAAWGDYANVQETALGGGKYSDFANANRYVEEGRVIFKKGLPTKAVEALTGKTFKYGIAEGLRKGSGTLLDLEDVLFSKPHYTYALAQFCKANHITAEQVAAGKGLDKARAYAILEAQKATYRDTNALSETISSLGRYRGDNPVKKGVSTVTDGILPFRKTPGNVLARGLEYSPLGFVNSLKKALVDVRQGNCTGAEAIDSISAGLTGTGLMALGMFLAAQRLVRGMGGEDEEKKKFEALQGHQAYALELPGGTSVTLDWLAPEALPFFVGVNLWEQTGGEKKPVTFSAILAAVGNVTDPLLEMSCLQSLNDLFDAVGYASSEDMGPLPTILASATTSYLTQAVPTLLGQAERTGQDVRMTTYTEKGAFLTQDMQYTLGKISGRVPGWDFNQIPYIDAWGRMETTGGPLKRAGDNFLNPAFTSTVETSPMEEELMRLYEATGEGGVLPTRAAKYITVDGERKDLTAEEYVEYATVRGQTAYQALEKVTAAAWYRGLDDADKAETVDRAYDYANAVAKMKVSDYKPDGWIGKAVASVKAGVPLDVYLYAYGLQAEAGSLKDRDGDTIPNSHGLLVMKAIYGVKGLNDRQRLRLFEDFGVGKTIIGYNPALVAEKLREMEGKGR